MLAKNWEWKIAREATNAKNVQLGYEKIIFLACHIRISVPS